MFTATYFEGYKPKPLKAFDKDRLSVAMRLLLKELMPWLSCWLGGEFA